MPEQHMDSADADKERLDWLESATRNIVKISFGPATRSGEKWVVTNGCNYFGRTLREAIDEARRDD